MMHYYHAFGLNIKSELLLPDVLVASKAFNISDLVIKFGEVDLDGLPQAASDGAFYQSSTNAFWLNVPDIARYLVTDGNQIIIHANNRRDEDSIRVFLLGSCMGALLMQRDLFLLHANAIKVGGHCVSFSGRSGIGKSTLSAAFMRRGYSILADDVCAINASQEVIPSFPQIKLWADASQKLAVQTKSLRKIRPNVDKFSVPLKATFHTCNLPLKVLYVLAAHNQDKVELKAFEGLKKILPLKNNTYRYPYLNGLGKTNVHLKHIGALASKISVVQVSRPKSGFQLDALVALIEDDLLKRGLLSV